MSGKYGYTIVQHSGGAGFERATETAGLTTKAALALVKRVGGVVFDDYAEAEAFSERADHPAGECEGLCLYPHANGTFSDKTIDGRRIYIPVREAVG